MTYDCDVVIVGAGHNGLTTAAYLARAGLAVQLVERRAVVGGCCVTQEIDHELAPGCRVSTCAYIASMLRPEVIRDLRLAEHGLRMVPLEPTAQAVFRDGDVAAWWNDAARLNAEIERIAPGEARTFGDVMSELRRLARYLQPFFLEAPPDTGATGLDALREKFRLWRRFRSLSGRDIPALVELLTGSIGEFLDRRFRSEKLKRLVLANSLYGKHGGPYQPGTAIGLLFHLLSGGEHGQQGWAGHVIGGMGAITQAMARAAEASGAVIRTGAAVCEIEVKDGRARGVLLGDGTQIRARAVVSNADPKRTFLQMLGPQHLDEPFRRQIAGIRMNGPCAKVNLVLSEAPAVNGMPADAAPGRRAIFTLIPTFAEAERCYASAAAGRLAAELWIDCVVPTLIDPDLAAPGTHVLTCFVQYVPYHLDGGWNARRERLGEMVIDGVTAYAPNVRRSVIARQVLTPLDLENEFGITEGNIFHGDPGLDQLFFMRPLPAWSQYRTPIPGLYLCGAGTHPGGGVTGAPGYNAARRILADWRSRCL